MSLQALADRYDVTDDGDAVAAAIDAAIERAEATIARLSPVCANIYAGEREAARRDLRFAITDRALLEMLEEASAA